MGKIYVKHAYNKWTDEEINLLKERKTVPGRTYASCCIKCSKLSLPMPVSEHPKPGWTEDEERMLREHRLPTGRSLAACKTHAYGMGIRISGNDPEHVEWTAVQRMSPKHESMLIRGKAMLKLNEAGMSFADIGRKLGISKQCVQSLVSRYREETNYQAKKNASKRTEELLKQAAAQVKH